MFAVDVRELTKTYVVPEREAGLAAAARSLFARRTRSVPAVTEVSFGLRPGEFVGFVGPNGAGKTTTLKMLSGLLFPTAGHAAVLGHVPSRRERAFLSRITLVMGQRNQLIWDIPVIDSLERNRVVYRVPAAAYRRTLGELTELLELGELLERPARNLSLGERMKCEIAVALVHRPEVLFLDEPTIGLDVTMQRRIRAFLAEHNRLHHTTVLLTSHYMADVEALCNRIIVIDEGRILFDGALAELVARFSPLKTVVVEVGREGADLARYGEVVASEGLRHTLRVPKKDTARVTGRLLADLPVIDLTVEDPPIEDVIAQVFAGGLDRSGRRAKA
ncbi:MAG: ATP-binding cassette domain-containing protein [Spirochaetaceae bacterium]|nr:ATP-binding cassette domain-containing protein [Spirochaetaceae bacterium]